jgi:hypothetical protein
MKRINTYVLYLNSPTHKISHQIWNILHRKYLLILHKLPSNLLYVQTILKNPWYGDNLDDRYDAINLGRQGCKGSKLDLEVKRECRVQGKAHPADKSLLSGHVPFSLTALSTSVFTRSGLVQLLQRCAPCSCFVKRSVKLRQACWSQAIKSQSGVCWTRVIAIFLLTHLHTHINTKNTCKPPDINSPTSCRKINWDMWPE